MLPSRSNCGLLAPSPTGWAIPVRPMHCAILPSALKRAEWSNPSLSGLFATKPEADCLYAATLTPWWVLSLGPESVICRALAVWPLEGFKDLSALVAPQDGGAVSGLTRPDVALTPRRSSVPAFPRGTPRWSAQEHHLRLRTSPVRSMACMMTARRRASATRALRGPRRLAILSAQLSARSAGAWRAARRHPPACP